MISRPLPVLTVTALLACGLSHSVHAQAPAERTLTVLATGSASAEAQRVSLQFSVTSQDQTATSLFVKQNDVVERLKRALVGAGVDKDAIRVLPFRLMPNYEYGQNGTRIIGYRLDTPIELEIDNVKDLPRIIDLATASGASTVTVGAFTLGKGKSLHEDALRDALAEARKEASVLAKEMGRTLGDIVSVSETEDAPAAPARGSEEEEERERGRGDKKETTTLADKAELRVVFQLK